MVKLLFSSLLVQIAFGGDGKRLFSSTRSVLSTIHQASEEDRAI